MNKEWAGDTAVIEKQDMHKAFLKVPSKATSWKNKIGVGIYTLIRRMNDTDYFRASFSTRRILFRFL
jgi:hypothetical protein